MSITLRGFQPQEEVDWRVSETPLVLTGTTLALQAYNDFITDKTTATSSDNNCVLSISPGTRNTSYQVTNLTPAICTFDSGNITRVVNGNCAIDISVPGSKKHFTRTMLRSGGGVSYSQTGYAVGSLAKHIADNIAAIVSGKIPGDSQFVFTGENYDVNAPLGTRNTGVFTTLDLSASSFAKNAGMQPAHLISDRHFACAKHVAPVVGQKLVWLGTDNVFRSATVAAISQLVGTSDISVGYLSAAITGITPYSLLPANWLTYLPSVASTVAGQFSAPALVNLYDDSSQRRKLHIIESSRQRVGQENWFQLSYTNPKAYPTWNGTIQGGDSGSPVILPIADGTLKSVLMCSMYTAFGGEQLAEQIPAINALMTSQAGSAYEVQAVSLAGFTTY